MLKRTVGVGFVIAALMAPSAAASSSALVLRAKGQVVSPGTRVAFFLGFRCAFIGMERTTVGLRLNSRLEANNSPVDSVSIRKKRPQAARCRFESWREIIAAIKSVKLTSGGEVVVQGNIEFDDGVSDEQPCVYDISELKGTFTIPGPVATKNLSGVGTLEPAQSYGGCAAQVEFTEVEATVSKGKQNLLAEAG